MPRQVKSPGPPGGAAQNTRFPAAEMPENPPPADFRQVFHVKLFLDTGFQCQINGLNGTKSAHNPRSAPPKPRKILAKCTPLHASFAAPILDPVN